MKTLPRSFGGVALIAIIVFLLSSQIARSQDSPIQLSEDIIYNVLLQTTQDSFPTHGSPHNIVINYPNNYDPSNVHAFLFVNPTGPTNCGSTCSPYENNLSEFTLVEMFQTPTTYTYQFGASHVGAAVSFFVLVLVPNPADPSQIYGIGYSNIQNLYFTEAPPEPDGYPLAFVSSTPLPGGFQSRYTPFGNHYDEQSLTGRGDDIWMIYPDGELRNLTQAAGKGIASGFQGTGSIAVRDLSTSWDGQRLYFSMIEDGLDGYCQEPNCPDYRWQIYKMENFGQGQTPIISKIPNQPYYNNIDPIEATDQETILFVSDRPRDGSPHHYPLRDEYELEETTSGIWRLKPSGELTIIDHSPSGSQDIMIDSYRRLLSIRWDHLERSQNVEQFDMHVFPDEQETNFNLATYANAHGLPMFPEPSKSFYWDVSFGSFHTFKFFSIWESNEDGTTQETFNHSGRHQWKGYFGVTDDFNGISAHENSDAHHIVENFFDITQDPNDPELFYFVDAPDVELHTIQAGKLVQMRAHPDTPANQIEVTELTNVSNGRVRNPIRLSDGRFIASWTPHSGGISGSMGNTITTNYQFRLVSLKQQGGTYVVDEFLTDGIYKELSFIKQSSGVGSEVSYAGDMWEIDPVEVRPRSIPNNPLPGVPAPEAAVFASEGINVQELQDWMTERNLALIVVRNATMRAAGDEQQPFNLKIKGSNTQTTGSGSTVYEIDHLQLWQGDRVGGFPDLSGRRIHAVPMHDPIAQEANLPSNGPEAGIPIGPDGSVAAFVPSNRAMSWQTTDGDQPIVRERYWVTFQAGEIRSCAVCHGLDDVNQAGGVLPQNQPEQLRSLMQRWKTLYQ